MKRQKIKTALQRYKKDKGNKEEKSEGLPSDFEITGSNSRTVSMGGKMSVEYSLGKDLYRAEVSDKQKSDLMTDVITRKDLFRSLVHKATKFTPDKSKEGGFTKYLNAGGRDWD